MRASSRIAAGCALGLLSACVHSPPSIGGVPGAPRRPNEYWTPPRNAAAPLAPAPIAALPGPESLTVAGVVDIALRNNPTTRISWAQARAAADAYGSSFGQWYPSVDLDVPITRSQSLALPGRLPGIRTQYGPVLSLSYLLLDFGGRAGSVDIARQTAVAASLTHNAALQNTILQVEYAYFGYLAARALRDAACATVEEASASLAAAEERHRVGLATIADVLQARTARSQAELSLESLSGAERVARGQLAVAMGLPANAGFEVPNAPDSAPVDSLHLITESVDSLMSLATRTRPDLAAVRAQAAAAAAQVRVARSAFMPTFSVAANGADYSSDVSAFAGRSYALSVGLNFPLFSGFSRSYDARAAGDELDAANARAESARQQIGLQVFTAYYSLQTATDRMRTATDLLASATESESVARGRYREGVGSIVDLLIAQSALADARAQMVQTRWQWRGALAQLAHDVGVLGLNGDALAPVGTGTNRGTR
jgi:outer membrane protein TolC